MNLTYSDYLAIFIAVAMVSVKGFPELKDNAL
jgi:hypothetical protein